MNNLIGIARSPVEGIYIVREDDQYWMVNNDGVAYLTGQIRPQLPEVLALVQRTLADRQEEQTLRGHDWNN